MFKAIQVIAAALLVVSCGGGSDNSSNSASTSASTSAAGTNAASQEQPAFTVDTYSYSALVKADNTWEVTETITVDFSQPRHGLYREIPLVFDYAGEIYHATIYDIDVVGIPFSHEINARNAMIRIGDKDVLVDGKQKYVMSYKYHIESDRIKDGDFMCQCVLGPQWNTTMNNFSFDIKFEKDLPQGFDEGLRIYSGIPGSTGNNAGVKVAVDMATNSITGSAHDLKPCQAITLSADLPEGYWN